MNVCMYPCVHVCTHVCVDVCMHACVDVCTHACVHMHTRMCACMHVCMRACVRACAYMHLVCVCLRACMRACTTRWFGNRHVDIVVCVAGFVSAGSAAAVMSQLNAAADGRALLVGFRARSANDVLNVSECNSANVLEGWLCLAVTRDEGRWGAG